MQALVNDIEYAFDGGPLSREAIRSLQVKQDKTPCFQTDLRIYCEDALCEWRHDCRRLVAEWRR